MHVSHIYVHVYARAARAGEEVRMLKLLNNIEKPLKLGYVAVRNRSPEALNANMSLEQARSHARLCARMRARGQASLA